MALGKMTYPLRGLDRGLAAVACKFVGNDAASPTVVEGHGVTVAWSATGTYTVTLDVENVDIKGLDVSLVQAAATSLIPFYTYDEATKVITLTVKDAEAAFADTDLTSSQACHVIVWLKG